MRFRKKTRLLQGNSFLYRAIFFQLSRLTAWWNTEKSSLFESFESNSLSCNTTAIKTVSTCEVAKISSENNSFLHSPICSAISVEMAQKICIRGRQSLFVFSVQGSVARS